MRNIIFIVLFCGLFFKRAIAQPTFCGAGYSTFYSANIFLPNNLNPTLDGQILPLGSHIIAVFPENGNWQCAGFVQWNGNSVSMVVNGNDGNLPGYAANEPYQYVVQLPNGCLIDSVVATYDVSGIYSNPGYFLDGGLSKLSGFHTFSRAWAALDTINGLCGDNTAVIETAVSPLGAPNTFLWSNGDTTDAISNLATGQYTVTVTNAFGCTTTTQATVSNVPEMSVQLATEYLFSELACNSVASVGGGTAPFSFAWSNGQSGNVATNLTDGDFSITVTDANGCTTVQTDHCTVSAVSDIPKLAHFSLAPNPSDGRVQVQAVFLENVEMSIAIYDAYGKNLLSKVSKGLTLNLAADLTAYPPGLYFVILQSDGRIAVAQLVVL